MIKGVNALPKKGGSREGVGIRMQEVKRFIESGKAFGQYVVQPGEVVENVYHSFRNSIRRMKLDEVIEITIRQRKLFFIRRDM